MICVLLYLIISGLLVRLILLLITSILTNQEAVLRRFVLTIYHYFMQQEGKLALKISFLSKKETDLGRSPVSISMRLRTT